MYERFRFYEISLEEKRRIVEKLRKILGERKEILLVAIYGSFLKDYPFRDIDIALYIRPGMDPLDYKFMLEKKLSIEIGYPVDVKVLNNAPAWFILEVFENGEILLDRSGIAEKVYKRALDEIISLKRAHV